MTLNQLEGIIINLQWNHFGGNIETGEYRCVFYPLEMSLGPEKMLDWGLGGGGGGGGERAKKKQKEFFFSFSVLKLGENSTDNNKHW